MTSWPLKMLSETQLGDNANMLESAAIIARALGLLGWNGAIIIAVLAKYQNGPCTCAHRQQIMIGVVRVKTHAYYC